MDNGKPESPAAYLKARYFRKVSQNSAYSLRAFARDLGISHSYLSQIMNEKRGLSLKQALTLANTLKLDQAEKRYFFELLMVKKEADSRQPTLRSPKEQSPVLSLDIDRFRTVQEWYHGAIVELTSLRGMRVNARSASSRLGISRNQALAGFRRLARLGVLKRTNGKWVKTNRRVRFTTTQSELSVRRFHQTMMIKAAKSMEETTSDNFAQRDITGITVAVDPSRIKEARKRIERFRNSLADFLSGGEPTAVYQLSIQIFPLTRQRRVPPNRKERQ